MRLLACLALLLATPAAAHLAPGSEVRLDFGRTAVAAEIVVPLGELAYAMRVRPTAQSAGAYLRSRIGAVAPDGRAWQVRWTALRIAQGAGGPDVIARALLVPPPGASVRRFTLRFTAVIDRVPNHLVLVAARSDYDSGQLGDATTLLGALQGTSQRLTIDRGAGNRGQGFAAALRYGMHHIAEGHDHLLFLLALLLPAPLVATAGRWTGYAGRPATLRRLVLVVTAFTVGHSLTLIAGAILGWHLPAQPVELAIALSVLLSAVHAARPIFAGREPLFAGLFGLVHGLAFATLIGRFGLEPMQQAEAIFGFNLGIELVQLAVVAAALPAMLLLAPLPAYRFVRLSGAALGGVAAAAWAAERALDADNDVAAAIEAALGYAPWLLAALTLLAAVLRFASRDGTDDAKAPLPGRGEAC